MIGCLFLLGVCSTLASVGAWTFETAALEVEKSTGRALDGGAYEMRIPSRGNCAWWERTMAIDASKGALRCRARAEIALDDPNDFVYNDVMLFVTFNYPKGYKRPPHQKFFKRDFIVYTDRQENGRLIRTFDETYNLPEGCTDIKAEVIGKWHAMTVKISDISFDAAPAIPPRKVRCVVGNPWEKAVDWSDPVKGRATRLGQIEATLTNIFAHVEKPDIILFSECFASSGTTNHAAVAEPVPGGPSWALAHRYATKHRCNIAMNVKERDEKGFCHNTVFVCDRDGKLVGRYRKVHLTSGEYQQGLVPGDGFPIFDLDFGRVGALVCWDNWFAESMKMVKREGAELLLFPLAGCAPDHVELTFPARAIDCGIPILVAMRQGHLPNGIIDRDGQWIAKTFEENGYAVADLDLNERKPTLWLSVGAGMGDPYELYFDEARPEIYEKFNWRKPRRP